MAFSLSLQKLGEHKIGKCHSNLKHFCFETYRWVTNDDSLASQDPSFFCDVCFQMLHYDIEGNKLGEFLAYPYVDPGIFNWDFIKEQDNKIVL